MIVESNPSRVKLGIRLDCITMDDGTQWPPYEREWLWAELVSDTQYRVKNVPFYAFHLALDDVVSTSPDNGLKGRRLFETVIARSGFSTFRAVAYTDIGDPTAEQFFDALAEMGCTLEGDQTTGVRAIGSPPILDSDVILALLQEAEREGILTFEVGFILAANR
ncbi:MAG: DUF4265 domain-containing protein [Vulcanimicrobiaceae bacterium]